MKPYVKTGFVLIADAPERLVNRRFYLLAADKAILDLLSQKEQAENWLSKIRASSSISSSSSISTSGFGKSGTDTISHHERLQRAETSLEKINSLCGDKESEIKGVALKQINLNRELEKAKEKIRDAGAAEKLDVEVQDEDGVVYNVAGSFFRSNDFMKCFNYSKAVIPHENIIGVSPNSVKGIVSLKETKLIKIIKQKSSRTSTTNNKNLDAHFDSLIDTEKAIIKSAIKYVETMSIALRNRNERKSGLDRSFMARQLRLKYGHSEAKDTIRKILGKYPEHWDPFY